MTLAPLLAQIVEIRDRHKMLFEAAIWAKLFQFGEKMSVKAGGMFDNTLQLPGVTPPLMRYGRKRFARVIELWLGGLLRKHPTGEFAVRANEGVDVRGLLNPQTGTIDPGAFGKASQQHQESSVKQFLAAVVRDMQQAAADGVGKARWTC